VGISALSRCVRKRPAPVHTGTYGQHPKIQLVTVAEILEGVRIDMPAAGTHMTQVAPPIAPEAPTNPDQLSLGA
jgi:hypothetical protein